MPKVAEFNRYIEKLCQALGHQDRHAGFLDYCRGLMLPIERKSVEPLAAYTDPLHVSAKHQSLHHLVAKSEWSDTAVLACVRDWVLPELGRKSQFYWIVDDTGFPKKGGALGGSSAPVLRAIGQAGQLPGGGQSVVGQRAWQCADRLAVVLARAVGQRSTAAQKSGCAQRG